MQTSVPSYRTPGIAACVMLLLACGNPKSSSTSGPTGGPTPTSRMTLDLRVEATDMNTASVRANLNNGKVLPTSYRLDGGDYFRACVNGVCRNMADNDSITSPDYIARFDYQPGVDFVVSFNRLDGQSAPDSRVALPPAFTIVTPADNQQVSDGDTVQVSWSPTGAPARVALSYSSDCKLQSGSHTYSSGTLSEATDADGSESVNIDHILTFVRSGSTSSITRCSIDVIVSHQIDGRVDPAFDHGLARGIVSRKVNMDYVPR